MRSEAVKGRVRAALVTGTTAVLAITLLPGSAVAAATVGTATQQTTSAVCEEDPQPTMTVANSRELDTPVVTSGTLLRAGQTGPVTDAPVRLMAWPKLEVLQQLTDGDRFLIKPIGRATTDTLGRFTMRIDPSIDLTEFTSENGNIDVSLEANTVTGAVTYDATIPRDIASADADEEELGTMPRTLDLELVESPDLAVDPQQVAALNSDEQAASSTSFKSLGDKRVRVGFINKVGSTATVWFQYSYQWRPTTFVDT